MWTIGTLLFSVLFLSITNGFVINTNLTLEELDRIGFIPNDKYDVKSKEFDNSIEIEKSKFTGEPVKEPLFIKVVVKPLCGSQCDELTTIEPIEDTTLIKNLYNLTTKEPEETTFIGSTEEIPITTETKTESETSNTVTETTLEQTQETTIKLTPHEHLLLITETEFYSPSESPEKEEFSSREITSENL